jgi:hypothetical protein
MLDRFQKFALGVYLTKYPEAIPFEELLKMIEAEAPGFVREDRFETMNPGDVADQIDELAYAAQHEFSRPQPEPYALCLQWTDRDPTVVAGAGPEDAYAKLVEAIKDDGAIAQLLDVSCRMMPESLEELQSLIECYNEEVANCKIVGVYASGAPVAESVSG